MFRLSRGREGHIFNPSTQDAEASGSLSSKSALSKEGVPRQPGLHREILKQNKIKSANQQTKSQNPL